MPRHLLVAASAIAAAVMLPSPARANVEIGGMAGVHVFSHTNELGVPDEPNAPSEHNSALFGVRVGYFHGAHWGIEGEVGFIPSEPRTMNLFDIYNLAYRAQVVYQFRAANPNNQLVPFAFVGFGAMTVLYSGEPNVLGAYCGQGCTHDTDVEGYIGGGVKYRVDNGWGLRGDAYILFPPSSSTTISSGDVADWPKKATVDFELLLSIYKEFGRKKAVKEVPAGPKDTDGDGIPDSEDKCPNEAEDKDGFQDEDGCPDPDNDGDGIPDAQDKCPNEPEDHDGFQDEDGCPDPDNDGDGIPDAQDKCPNEPEDKDGFQDADGCPDPDNDGDGIPDAQDKCPNQPETKNGYQDEDGCPDEIPAKLKKFTGVIQGINFKVNSAELLPGSNKTLDQAISVLKEFGDLRLEVQGHTDDQPMGKGGQFADNKALSQARADTVKAYFVAGGIDAGRLTSVGFGDEKPITDPKGLTAGKLGAARAKNRRVEFRLMSGSGGGGAPAPAPAPAPAAPKAAAPAAAPKAAAPAPKAAAPATPSKTPAPAPAN
jgi:outer membrane protein OmpA-like peptidoglycan-associated protein